MKIKEYSINHSKIADICAWLNNNPAVLEEIKKLDEDNKIYKRYNNLLMKSRREDILKEYKEKKVTLNTRMLVVEKQEIRVKDNLKEVENKIIKMRNLLNND